MKTNILMNTNMDIIKIGLYYLCHLQLIFIRLGEPSALSVHNIVRNKILNRALFRNNRKDVYIFYV